jgi:hypothetical protein
LITDDTGEGGFLTGLDDDPGIIAGAAEIELFDAQSHNLIFVF